MTHTSVELCSELRRLGDAGPETITIISELWATEPKNLVPLLQTLMNCGIVEGTRFRKDVWSRSDVTKAATQISYIPMLPNQLIDEEKRRIADRLSESNRQRRIRDRKQKEKEEKEYDIYCMAGI